MTLEQRLSLLRKWQQDNQGMTFYEFQRTAEQGYDCIMVKWCNMWLGIESDGYTHS